MAVCKIVLHCDIGADFFEQEVFIAVVASTVIGSARTKEKMLMMTSTWWPR